MEHHPLGYDIDETTVDDLRARLDSLLVRVAGGTDVVVVNRPDGKAVALIDAAELSILMEEVFLFTNKEWARRHFDAMDRIDRGEVGRVFTADEFDVWMAEQRRLIEESAAVVGS